MYNSNLENALQDVKFNEDDAAAQEALANQRRIDAERAQIAETKVA
jgi:hypothetical protein